jgi:hypothetical protein
MWRRLLPGLLLTAGGLPLSAVAGDVAASAPTDVSVTVYRDPNAWQNEEARSLALDDLGGFALVTETRTVLVPAGESRIRFEGVADGIDAASALITGLPNGVLEKNRDAAVLSPSALVAATVGKSVTLVRTNKKTGQAVRVAGKMLSDADGVVFESTEGAIEALRCSGLSETFQFEPVTDLNSTPTLSALVRSPQAFTAQVKLSYLSRGFDWQATYTATLAADGKTLDLGAWVTLANSNATSFANAHAQVVAGRLNRESGEVEPVDWGQQVVAQCWPRGSTSDTPTQPHIDRAEPIWDGPFVAGDGYVEVVVTGTRRMQAAMMSPAPAAISEVVVTRSARAQLVKEEQLGDLKLYRVPERTDFQSRQVKQVRLLDRQDIPVKVLYGAEMSAGADSESIPLRRFVRIKNDSSHHLGVPLPSGHMASFAALDQTALLLQEAPVRDTTLAEEVEFELGQSADVRLSATTENRARIDLPDAPELLLLPGVWLKRFAQLSAVSRIDLTNAKDVPVVVEIGLSLYDDERVVKASVVPRYRNGHPTFNITVPANGVASVSYQTEEHLTRPLLH